ncbi:unnamed protein product [Nyctereutes procyonoides]|uniref:(raccoon dog) hypothetical protein n=1 Tax=Nyctereutes procyonoides TaxID=34880 RepID=A0A811Y224_NYCPR|nr:unnamed protein product [Nyctereutes procyonoides]
MRQLDGLIPGPGPCRNPRGPCLPHPTSHCQPLPPPPSPLAAWPPDSPRSSPEGQEPRGWGSSYLRGEAPGPGGGGGSGCGAPAPRRLLHHNIPRPGARGPRGRAPSRGGARRAAAAGGGGGRGGGGGPPSWAARGRERASPSQRALAAAPPRAPPCGTPALSPRCQSAAAARPGPAPPSAARPRTERARPAGPWARTPARAPQRRGWTERERLWRWPGRTDAEIQKGKATCLQSQDYSNTFPG